jgi:hypothetical protein
MGPFNASKFLSDQKKFYQMECTSKAYGMGLDVEVGRISSALSLAGQYLSKLSDPLAFVGLPHQVSKVSCWCI